MSRHRVVLAGLSSLAFLGVIVSATPEAEACRFQNAHSFQARDEPSPEDVEPPSDLSITLEEVRRGRSSRGSGGSSCDDLGYLKFGLKPGHEEWGYRLDIVDGSLPDGIWTSEPFGVAGESVTLSWIDGDTNRQEPIRAKVRMTPIDKWGREGEPSNVVEIDHAGSGPGACNVAGSRPPFASWLMMVLAVCGTIVGRRWSRR